MKKKNRLRMLAALLAATLSMALTAPIAARANEDYNVRKEEATANTGRIYYLKNSHGDVIGQMDENGTVLPIGFYMPESSMMKPAAFII